MSGGWRTGSEPPGSPVRSQKCERPGVRGSRPLCTSTLDRKGTVRRHLTLLWFSCLDRWYSRRLIAALRRGDSVTFAADASTIRGNEVRWLQEIVQSLRRRTGRRLYAVDVGISGGFWRVTFSVQRQAA